MTKEKFKEIIRHLSKLIEGTEFENHVFAVGGCIRDLVMIDKEIKDIDLVIDLENGGIRLAKWLYEKDYTTGEPIIYPTYGTAMFFLNEYPCEAIECVMTRKEQYKDPNSRNPETEYGTIDEDAFRRDFTCNTLYLRISNNKYLSVDDPTGKGLEDIRNGVIRSTSDPDIIFSDDALRMLRAFRFSCRYNWKIEEGTWNGIVKNVHRLQTVSKERIMNELVSIFMNKSPEIAIRQMVECGLMKYIIPELCETVGMEQNKFHDKDVFGHTLDVLSKAVLQDTYFAVVRMAALLHDIGKVKTRTVDEKGNVHFYNHESVSTEMAKDILTNLKCSARFISLVCFLVKNHMETKSWGDDLSKMKMKNLRKLQHKCGTYSKFRQLMILIDADNKSHASEHCLPNQVENIMKITHELMIDGTDMFNYILPITGNDVMKVKNIGPSEQVKECLDYAMKLAYNDPTMDRETMLKHVKGYKFKQK